MKLSRRLQYIMEQIPNGSRLADIGSDHALLPVAAIKSGRVIQAIAGEVNSGPLDAATKQVLSAGLKDQILVRLGDGLEVISAGEVDVITIAGMGGGLISSILNSGQDKLQGVKMLVLQPNVGEDILRRWLLDNHWVLTSEHIMEEDRKVYEVLTAVPVSEGNYDQSNEDLYREYRLHSATVPEQQVEVTMPMLLRMGPWLLKNPNSIFVTKWMSELLKLERILESINTSNLSSAEEKSKEVLEEIGQIKGVLACLQKDRL